VTVTGMTTAPDDHGVYVHGTRISYPCTILRGKHYFTPHSIPVEHRCWLSYIHLSTSKHASLTLCLLNHLVPACRPSCSVTAYKKVVRNTVQPFPSCLVSSVLPSSPMTVFYTITCIFVPMTVLYRITSIFVLVFIRHVPISYSLRDCLQEAKARYRLSTITLSPKFGLLLPLPGL
jgi:hypothetical protein